MLAAFDEAAEHYHVPGELNDYSARDVEDRLHFWLRDVPDNPLVQEARHIFSQAFGNLDFTMQHGDLTPWQILNDHGTWIIIDGERSGDDLPRFNDVAYSYGRLAARCGDRAAADEMLVAFITRRNLSESVINGQLKPVMVWRLLGMLGDANEDINSEEYTRVEQILQDVLKSIQ
jgi:hypothetical protein